ncbi:hypothetical protein C8N46_103440 [Kordia periserrulae]|uniref:LTXXQ motif family protein n=1 Tax=Kordia periserrulae TaxID=701523 RepID=A0A2T6C1Z0_9FLAO|nr:hypothetical protein [Kordia periserrulae]PTX62340.1 hypothetical protein C8N46_103440 [Kordia periserrulae]
MKKLLFICLFVLGFATTAVAQNKKMIAKAEKKIEKINTQITSVDSSLALSDAQKEQITAIEIKTAKAIKALRKEISDKDELKEKVKELNKEAGKEISKNVLTKKQRKARSTYRKQNKN